MATDGREAELRRWWRKWMTKLQRHPSGEDFLIQSLEELNDLGSFLNDTGCLLSGDSKDAFAAKREAVATLLSQHFRARWPSTSADQQTTRLGTSPRRPGLDRPVGNLAMPGASLDAAKLRAVGVDYINAASVPLPLSTSRQALQAPPSYIATQHPLPATVSDFWCMVIAERPACIVMLNGFDYLKVGADSGDAAEACAEYWREDAVARDPELSLEELDVRRVGALDGDDGDVNSADVVRTLRITLRAGSAPQGVALSHTLRHLCVSWWRDQASPELSRFVASWRLLQKLSEPNGEYFDYVNGATTPKVVVHCAGGIGRVGVLIAADLCARSSYCTGGFICPDQAIRYLRSRRVNMVQSEAQYIFLHYAIGHLAAELKLP